MRKLNIILIFIFLGATIFGLALFLNIPHLVSSNLAAPPNLNKAENVLLYRSSKALGISKEIVAEYEAGGPDKPFATLAGSRGSDLKKLGLSLYMYRGDSLIFWTDTRNVSSIEQESKARLVFVNNTWSIALWIAHGSIDVLALVKIKEQYPIQNKFLKSEYHPSLSFLNDFSLVPYFVEGAFPLRVFGGAPLMFFAHNPKDFEGECARYRAYIAWGTFISFLLFVLSLSWTNFFTRRSRIGSLIVVFFLVGVRLAFLYWQVLPSIPWRLFSAEVFAYTWLYPSLGDFLVNSVLLFAVMHYVSRNLPIIMVRKNRQVSISLAFLMGLLSFAMLLYTDSLFRSLVVNSTVNFETYKIFNLSVFSLVGYLALSLWFASAIMLLHWTLKLLWRQNPQNVLSAYIAALLVIVGIKAAMHDLSFYGLAFLVAVTSIVAFSSWRTRLLKFWSFILLVGVFSIYSVLTVSQEAIRKDRSVRKVMAVNLGNERDPIAEIMFPGLARKLQYDKHIMQLMDDIEISLPVLYDYLSDNFLNGYLAKYDFQITACTPTSKLSIENTGEQVDCYPFFEEMLNEYGFRIPGSSFYHLSNQNGRISYLGIIEYTLDDGEEITLYLELDSKLSRELLGYPELLLESKGSGREPFGDYSTAKYSDSRLIARSGSYNYSTQAHFPNGEAGRYVQFDEGGFNHLVYHSEGDITLVVSRANVNLFNITASFAWMFLFFYGVLFVWLRVVRFPIRTKLVSANLSARIRGTMTLLLLLSMVLVGLVTIAYNIQSFEKKSRDSLAEKLLSVSVDVEENLVAANWLLAEHAEYLTYYTIYLSNIFYTDINLFDREGALLASSRPEVVERKLLGSRMNPTAWYELAFKHQSQLIQTEEIGKMRYTSAYVPLAAQNGEVAGYLNLPFFTRQSEFMREISMVLVALINIYALLILFTLFVAILISNRITRPLELIRGKLRKIDLGKHNEPILYSSNDEVGLLVKEYNRMVAELSESAEKLAQSQRQSAWREMAKQIAHEIKNPLTPMRLSVQHLMKAKKEQQPNWEELFDKFSGSLIQQINTLNNIATEFSNFAQMPVSNPKLIAMKGLVEEAVNLYSSYWNVDVRFKNELDDTMKVFIDNEQILRVFVNLLKNAIQAIPKGKQGQIDVWAGETGGKVIVSITDNGMGMDEESKRSIFSPNFTTKSGGMGLGLAMSREMVKSHGGRIWFESEQGTGTTFFIELPLAI